MQSIAGSVDENEMKIVDGNYINHLYFLFSLLV